MLTDSYKITEEGYASLSGKSIGVSGVAKQTIASISGGDTVVEFKPIDIRAKNLVEKKLKKEYINNEEGFIIEVGDSVTVYADTERAKLFAACAVKDKCNNGKISRGLWWSYPCVAHRSLRIFLPPKGDIEYFYKLIDMLVHLGYNSILLEICGAMEFKSHPELNKAWIDYCNSVNEYPDKYSLVGKGYKRVKNSVHSCNAGGGVYTQEEMKEIVKYCADRFVEIIPEVPSLSHSEYICIAHPELRECDDEPYASAACPSNPELNKLVFDLYDEVIDVFGCKALHIGHDEWWVMCVCDKCKDKDPVDLYVTNVLESYNYLKSKGVKTYMWGDKLLNITDKEGECHGATGKVTYSTLTKKDVKTVNIMGEDYPVYDRHWFRAPEWAQKEGFKHTILDMTGTSKRLPPDITYCNWYYACEPDIENSVFNKEGKDMILGNAIPSCINNYKQRFKYGASGLSVSSWAETSELAMQEWGAPFELGYGSIICWNHDRDELDFRKNVFDAYEGLFRLYNRDTLDGHYLEVTHTSAVDWKDGRKYCMGMNVPDKDFLTMGNYEVTYTDGRIEKFPVMFTLNIAYGGMRLERCAHNLNWDYAIDEDLSHTSPMCNISIDNDEVWYTAVMPLSGDVSKCEYVPKAGFEEYVIVRSIEIR